MDNQSLQNIREDMLSKESELLDIKGGEYGADFDRLLNFKEIGDFLDMRATEVCLVLLLKHIQSITLAIKSGNYHSRWYWKDEKGNEGLKQKIADARNYLLLLAACIEDEGSQNMNFSKELQGDNDKLQKRIEELEREVKFWQGNYGQLYRIYSELKDNQQKEKTHRYIQEYLKDES